jgi:DNA ligase-1
MMHGIDFTGENLAGWWLAEKLDGCRAWWTGETLLTRSGHNIAIPDVWKKTLPKGVVLEGELWAGSGRRAQAARAVRWGRFDGTERLVIFDVPGVPDLIWLRRLDLARTMLAGGAGAFGVDVVEPQFCAHNKVARLRLDEVQQRGGEGLIARAPRNFYRAGRTGEVLKLKRVSRFL